MQEKFNRATVGQKHIRGEEMNRDISFMFDDLSDGYTITITDHSTERYINAPLKEDQWPELLTAFVQMLNGLGFIIDPVEAEKAIDALSEANSK